MTIASVPINQSYKSINVQSITVVKLDVVGGNGDAILGEERVASPETRARDVTNIESRLDHVIAASLRTTTRRQQRFLTELVTIKGKGTVFPYSLPSVGPGADPGVQAVSRQVT